MITKLDLRVNKRSATKHSLRVILTVIQSAKLQRNEKMNKSELHHKTLHDILLYQDKQHKQLFDRAVSLIGFAIAIVAAGVITLNFLDNTTPNTNGFLVALGVWTLTFLCTIGFCATVLMPQDWNIGISVKRLNELMGSTEYGEGYIHWTIIKDLEAAINHNQEILDRKTEALRIAIMFLVLEALGLITVGSSVIWWKIYPSATTALGFVTTLA